MKNFSIKTLKTICITTIEIDTEFKDFQSKVELQIVYNTTDINKGDYEHVDIECTDQGNYKFMGDSITAVEFKKKNNAWLQIYEEDPDRCMTELAINELTDSKIKKIIKAQIK